MRISDSTVVCVWRVNIQESTGYFYATLVNLIVLGLTPETKTFSVQAADLKEIISLYNPREVVIDTNGLGVGLADEMIKETYAGNGKVYPAYGFKNDRNYQRIQPSNAINILIGMKAGNSSIKKNDGSPATPISAINGNAYTRINSGKVRFLIKEQEAKSALLATKVGQKMTPNQRIERLMPHTLTTKLFDEMANLRLKPNTVEVTVERINAHKPKDKFSALSYGLWRIKELEDEYSRTYKRKGRKRKLIFYN